MARHFLSALALLAPLAIIMPSCAQMPSTGAGAEGSYAGQYEEQGKDGAFDTTKIDPSAAAHDDQLARGADLVKQGKYSEAIPYLEKAYEKDTHNATTLIYLGFAHRMLGDTLKGDARDAEFGKALDAYRKGLAIDSKNRLLHEYLGKLYLLMRKYDLAQDEMKRLDDLCSSGCAERSALSDAITANPPPPVQPKQ